MMALVSTAPAPRPFYFRRRKIGRGELPLVITGPMGTREGPFTAKDQTVHVRASSVKDFIFDKGGLVDWTADGRMWASATNDNLRLQVAAVKDWTDDEGKLRMRDLRDRADVISGATDRREGGTAYHQLFARFDRGEGIPAGIPDEHRYALDAYRRVMRLFVVHEIELAVVCDALTASGNLDKILSPKGVMIPRDRKGRQIAPPVLPTDRVVGDVKAAKDPKYFHEFTLQFTPYTHGCAYREEEDPVIRAQQEEDAPEDLWTPEARLARVKAVHRTPINVRTDVALLIHVPYRGAHAELFWFNTAEGFAPVEHAMGTRRIRTELRATCARAELPVVEGIDVEAPLCPNCVDSFCPGCDPTAAAAQAWGVVGPAEPVPVAPEDNLCARGCGLTEPHRFDQCPATVGPAPAEEVVNGLTIGEAYDQGQREHDAAQAETAHAEPSAFTAAVAAVDPVVAAAFPEAAEAAEVAAVDPTPAGGVLTSPNPVLQPGADGTFAGSVFAHVKAQQDAHRLRDAIRNLGTDSRAPSQGGPTEQDLLDLYRTNYRVWRPEHTAAAADASAAIAARETAYLAAQLATQVADQPQAAAS